jgi:hypothetical protein
MMTAETAAQRSIYGPDVRHDRINALRMPGVLEVEIGLRPLEFYQKLFPEDLNSVKPEEIIHFPRGLLYGYGNIDPA